MIRTRLPLALLSLASLLPASADVVINEVRIDNGGTDSEYFELFNNGASAADLTGFTYVVIGDGSGGSGVIESVTDLGGQSIGAGGYFLVVNSNGETLTGIDSDGDTVVDITVTADLAAPLQFENGDNVTHLLVQAFTGASGDDLDTDDDGVLDVTPWSAVVDAVGVIEEPNPPSGTEYSYGEALGFVDIGPNGPFAPGHVFRVEDGAEWAIGQFGTNLEDTTGVLSPNPDPLLDTPGLPNPSVAQGSLELSLSANPISESGGFSATTLTVTRVGSTEGDVTVTLSLDDPSEATLQGTEVILFDTMASTTIDLDAIDDLWPDGDQTVTLTASAPNFGSADISLTVQDDSDPAGLVLNEVYLTPNYLDANGDGSSGFDDAFVEIVNAGASPADLSFFTLRENGYDNRGEVHVFPEGTVLAPGSALVVFGGGAVVPGTSADFGSAEVQLASSGGLFLSTGGEQLSLRDQSDLEVAGITLPDVTGTPDDGSFTLMTDGDLSSGYVRHTATVPATDFSPGTQVDGTPFATVSQSLMVTINTPTILENAGSAPGAVTVTLPANATSDTVVRFFSSDQSELFVQDNATIPSGSDSVTIDVFPVDDPDVDGDQAVTVSAIASGYLNGSGMITVEDDGTDTPTFTDLVINEFDADQPGADAAEFVELYNNSSEEQSLDGLVVVMFNGNGDTVSDAFDLSGYTIPANGFFVLGNAGVPNLDLEIDTNSLQNGPGDAIAVFSGSAADYPFGTSVVGIPGTLVDAVVYDGDDTELQAALDPAGVSIPEGDPEQALARATDGGSAFGSAAFVAQAPTPGTTNVIPAGGGFSDWATANGIGGEPFDGDFDGDGIPNGVEYGVDGLNPAAPDSLADHFDGSTLSFDKRPEAVANGDVSWEIEESDDLGGTDPWTVVTPDADTDELISYTLPTGAGTIFARLQVSEVVAVP